ncbi:MAG TPA: hypothetical protein VGO11_19605 [Chthoniobacteraceae bacterium]|jgi:hypothetical protein|nr:hypothetical protein [Chthoniobacteraceae bacterium]
MQKGKLYSLEALTADPQATRNTVLFACLTAIGIPPEPALCGEYVEKVDGAPRSVTVWRLRERSLCGKYGAEEAIKLFSDPEFAVKQPEHPLAYLKSGFENYFRAVAFVKDQGPIVVRRRGKKIALITRHTDEARRARILDELNK